MNLPNTNTIEHNVFVASHRRSGTHLTLDSLVANFNCFKGGFRNFDGDHATQDVRLFKTHIDGLQARHVIPTSSKVIYVVRDGRDVMVSLYNYTKTHDPKVEQMGFSKFLLAENNYSQTAESKGLNRIEYWNHHVQSWLMERDLACRVITFDQWKARGRETVAGLGVFLEMDPNPTLKSMVMNPRKRWVQKVLGKLGLSKNTAIQFRGGRSKVWKEYFDSESLEYFAQASKKTYQLVSDKVGFDFKL